MRLHKSFLLIGIFIISIVIAAQFAACSISAVPVSMSQIPDNYIIPVSNSSNPLLPDFVSVLRKVRPSVVAINNEMTTFDIFGGPQTQEAAGSGWILDTQGHVVTNNHVVENATNIKVTLTDGKSYAANVIGADSLTDLAILKINADNLTAINIGDTSQSQVGDWVLTVGNSLGLGITAKEGIISRLGVSLQATPSETLDNLIETSAAINPGNSGGPLVNMRGEIIGINSLKISTSGVEGMGYAINIDSALPILSQLLQTGYIVRPWLGISAVDVNPFVQAFYGLSTSSGALITNVASNSPASKAGIAANDIIIGFNNTEITSSDDLVTATLSAKIGDKVTLTYIRNNAKNSVQVTLGQSPGQ